MNKENFEILYNKASQEDRDWVDGKIDFYNIPQLADNDLLSYEFEEKFFLLIKENKFLLIISIILLLMGLNFASFFILLVTTNKIIQKLK